MTSRIRSPLSHSLNLIWYLSKIPSICLWREASAYDQATADRTMNFDAHGQVARGRLYIVFSDGHL
jgi:hypothetical protein